MSIMIENLEAFFEKKKINHQDFKKARPLEWLELEEEFNILGFAGFDSRKKFLINDWRLLFPNTTSLNS